MSFTLDRDFEESLEQALLNDVEQTARETLGPALKQTAAENWQQYAAANDYDIDHIWQDAELTVSRGGDSVEIRIEWPELTALFEFGVSPHTIEGNPLLHFLWEDAPGGPQWVQTTSVDWGSETGGIPESRAIRDALNDLRRQL